jgi:thiol-disulfide isomerase/thioredoxin
MKLHYFLLFTLAILLFTGCRPAAAPVSVSNQPMSNPETNLPLPPDKPMSKMSWKTFDGTTNIDGDEQQIGDLKGKVVVLDFWATYCPPCLDEIPHLNELQTKHKENGLEIIGLNVGGEEDRPKVPAFAKKLNINYTLATPERALEVFIFQTDSSIPQTLVLDREGKLVERFVGYNLKIKNDLEKAIEKALAN